MLVLTLFAKEPLAREINVCPSCEFKSIKEALEGAEGGDSLIIHRGTYREGTILVKKSVRLIGKGFPVLDGEGKYEVVRIEADNVLLEGFRIVNSGRSDIEDIAAVKVENAKGCVIRNNVLEDNFWAIYLANVSECRVEKNRIRGPFRVGEAYSGNGIHLWHCRNVVIKDNRITGHRDGIYFEFVEDSLIEGNLSEGNWRYGLHFMFSHRDRYIGNTFRRNGVGVAVMYTKKVVMRDNVFELNWGGASYGLLLKAIDDSLVEHNLFYKNTAGILMDECQRTTIRENDFLENGWALRIWANSWNNLIVRNNFLSNTFDLSTNSTMNPNRIEENYWSAYRGYDLNRDGFGDIPYKPVKLFSYVVENNPAAAVLVRSFFVKLLNIVEETFPVVVSVSVQDDKPLMRRVEWKR
ncbi:nitrous oxide reductase family maturation protein NosD [Hydrogenivirga sp.]